jgi:asparagine synthase (glutamine-hydrolysing)
MCGIAGVIDFGRASAHSNKSLVSSAISKLQHRGPDEKGFYDSENCSLGMCRLSIIDVKGGQQPNHDSSGRIISVFNGEIYNYREIRDLLVKRGYSLSSEGDSVCIPFLYREFADNFPKYLNGMFAVAIWDEDKKRGLLARDRFGEKPLWYKNDGNRTSFSSELKSLKELNGNLEFDPSRLPEYLQFGYINSPRSIYKNVKQLTPGTTISIDANGIKENYYWSFPIGIRTDITYDEAKSTTKTLITEAVKKRLISERPIGSFLSGGIDSSLVTALMSREMGANLRSYSIGFDNPKYDESVFARRVANHLGIKHQEKIVRPDSTLILNEIAGVLDQPFADSSIIPTYLLAKFARNEVVVALGGDGGDEVFGGYSRYRITKLLDRLNFLLLLSPTPVLKRLRIKDRKFEKLFTNLKFKSMQSRYFSFQSLLNVSQVRESIKAEIDESELNLELVELWNSIVSMTQLQKLQKFDLQTYLPGDLMFKSDMATMANSLELRSPLLDYRVVEFGLSLPDDYKINPGTSKRILRDILYELVPRELVDRQKMGFAIPQNDWLRNELSDFVAKTLLAKSAFIASYLNMNFVEKAILEHNEGLNREKVIWPILMFELWAQRNLS